MLLPRYFGVRQEPSSHGRAAGVRRLGEGCPQSPGLSIRPLPTFSPPLGRDGVGNPLRFLGWAIRRMCGPCRTCPSGKARMQCCCWHPPRRCCVLSNKFKVPHNPRATFQACRGLSRCTPLAQGCHYPGRHRQLLGQQWVFHPTPRPFSLPSILGQHILFPSLPNPR